MTAAAILVGGAVASTPAYAQQAQNEEPPATFAADEMTHDKELGTITARGHVEVNHGERTLLADAISYNQTSDTIRATGNVALHLPSGDILFADVMEMVFQSWEEIPITENHIKQLHRDLLRYSEKDERHRGEYKTIRNDVGAFDPEGKMIGVVFETATPFDTPARMSELISWFQEVREIGRMHPLLIVAVFVVIFLEIHPFQDGNGRLSRVLTTLLLLQTGYAYVPYSSLESIIENSKEGYYLALRQTQGTIKTEVPNWQPWLMFFMRSLQQQKRRLSKKVEWEKNAIATLPDLAIKILDYVRDHGRVTTRDMVREHDASPNTLKSTFGALVKKGLLVRHGGGRSTWYGRL